MLCLGVAAGTEAGGIFNSLAQWLVLWVPAARLVPGNQRRPPPGNARNGRNPPGLSPQNCAPGQMPRMLALAALSLCKGHTHTLAKPPELKPF